MSARQQHRVLARLAEDCWRRDDWHGFHQHYDRLRPHGRVDCFNAPAWLTPSEQLWDAFRFHAHFAGLEIHQPSASDVPLAWQPRFRVEVVADRVRSPYNMGALARLVDNFGFECLRYCAPWFEAGHAQFKRAARGCQRWVPLISEPDLPGYLRGCGRRVVGLETGSRSQPLAQWRPPAGPVSLVVGHEEQGISQAVLAHCHERVGLEMFGHKTSMNLSHALAVVASHGVVQSLFEQVRACNFSEEPIQESPNRGGGGHEH